MKKKTYEEPVKTVEDVEEVVAKPEKKSKAKPIITTFDGKVIAKMLNVRPDPSMDNIPLRILYEGDAIEYTVENDEWYKLVDGGYVMAKHIQ